MEKKKETYWLEDKLYKTKRYFTVEDGFVNCEGYPSVGKLLDFLALAEKFGYKWGKL